MPDITAEFVQSEPVFTGVTLRLDVEEALELGRILGRATARYDVYARLDDILCDNGYRGYDPE